MAIKLKDVSNKYGESYDTFEISLVVEEFDVEYAGCGTHHMKINATITRSDLVKMLEQEVEDQYILGDDRIRTLGQVVEDAYDRTWELDS